MNVSAKITPSRFAANPENEKAVSAIVDVLSASAIGEVVTYATLAAVTKMDIQREKRYVLQSAVERVEEELSCAFATVRDVGIKRLSQDESPEIGRAALTSIRRRSRHAADRLERTRGNASSDTAQKQNIAYVSMLRTISAMADGNHIKQTVKSVSPVPPADILAGLKK